MENEFLTYKQASDLLQIQIGTLYSLVSQKRIPHIRISGRMVRFQKSEMESWIKKLEVKVNNSKKGRL